jgi:hypothetical protein
MQQRKARPIQPDQEIIKGVNRLGHAEFFAFQKRSFSRFKTAPAVRALHAAVCGGFVPSYPFTMRLNNGTVNESGALSVS